MSAASFQRRLTAREVSSIYKGGICSVKLFNQRLVVINSISVLDELNKQGSSFSSRPPLKFAGQLAGVRENSSRRANCYSPPFQYSNSIVLSPYGPRLRNLRRMAAKMVGSPFIVEKFRPMQEYEAHRFLLRVLKNPNDLEANIRM